MHFCQAIYHVIRVNKIGDGDDDEDDDHDNDNDHSSRSDQIAENTHTPKKLKRLVVVDPMHTFIIYHPAIARV